MAVSDIIFEAEEDIRAYLDQTDIYTGNVRDEIERLLAEMRRVRFLPGLDSPPVIPTVIRRKMDWSAWKAVQDGTATAAQANANVAALGVTKVYK